MHHHIMLLLTLHLRYINEIEVVHEVIVEVGSEGVASLHRGQNSTLLGLHEELRDE